MKCIRGLCCSSWGTTVAWVCAALAACLAAGCSNSMSDMVVFTRTTGIGFSTNAQLEKYAEEEPSWLARDPTVYAKVVTDETGYRKTVATLPKTSRDWKKAEFDGNEWSRLSTIDRLGIGDHSVAADTIRHEVPPSWWQPDSIGKPIASRGNLSDVYWSFIGGRDASGRYVMFVFYFQT